jgi:hypothetical protein
MEEYKTGVDGWGVGVFLLVIVAAILGSLLLMDKISQHRAEQVQAQAVIAQAQVGIEQAHEAGATERAQSFDLTLASVTAMVVASVSSGNALDSLLLVGVIVGALVWLVRQKRE